MNDAGYRSLIPIGEKHHPQSYLRVEHVPDAQRQFYSRSQEDAALLQAQMGNLRGSFRIEAHDAQGRLLNTATFMYSELRALALGDKGIRQRFDEKILPSCRRK